MVKSKDLHELMINKEIAVSTNTEERANPIYRGKFFSVVDSNCGGNKIWMDKKKDEIRACNTKLIFFIWKFIIVGKNL